MNRFRLLALLAVLLVPLTCLAQTKPPPGKGDDKSSSDSKPITIAEAAKMVGKNVTVEMEVKGTGQTNTLVFLNSESDRNDEKNFVIVIDKDVLTKAKIDDVRKTYRGKTVRVTGKVETYRDKPQIKVKDIKNLQVVEK